MQIKILSKRPYNIVIFLVLYISFITFETFASEDINIINLAGYIVQLFLYSGLIYYILFINKIILRVENNDSYVSLYHNDRLLHQCLETEITTDNRFAYFFDKKLILLIPILNITNNNGLILTILSNKKNIKVINEKKLFFLMFFQNIYFKIYILIFLMIPIIAIIQSIG